MSANTFILETFMKMADNSYVKELLRRMGADVDSISLEGYGKHEHDLFYRIYEKLPSENKNQLEGIARTIHQFANSAGLKILNTSAHTLHVIEGWKEIMQSDQSPLNKAFAVWFYYDKVFYHAQPYLDITTRRWCLECDAIPHEVPDLGEDQINLLQDDLEGYLMDNEGRGKVCTVKVFHHENKTYLCVYADDYTEHSLRHNEERQLVPLVVQRTFAFVFAIDPNEGTSCLSITGGTKFKLGLENVFLHLLYGIKAPKRNNMLNIQMLKDFQFRLSTRSEDQVEARVKKIKLSWNDKSSVEVSVPVKQSHQEAMLNNLLERRIQDAYVARAEISFTFYQTAIHKKKVITITVGDTESTDLLNEERYYVNIIKKYFILWGMYDEERLAGISASGNEQEGTTFRHPVAAIGGYSAI